MQLSVDSYWADNQGLLFLIVELGEGSDPWVHYKNIATGQEYSCMAGAFLQRFRKTEHDTR